MGQVVGYFESPDLSYEHPFVFDLAWGVVDIGPAESEIAIGLDINDRGQIVGRVGGPGAFRYTPGLGFEFLGADEAYAINNRGQVTGWGAFRYTDGVGMEHVAQGIGYAINDLGWLAGDAGAFTAFIYRDDQGMQILGPGRGFGINNQGVVVGEWWGFPAVFTSPAIWANGETHLLGTFGGDMGSAYAVNAHSEVVGYALSGQSRYTAFYWNAADGMQDLNTLVPANSGWYFLEANDISNQGWIVGDGYYQGKSQAYLLLPIQPKLTITRAGTNIVISWTPHWPRLVLETAPYYSPTNWQAVPGGTNSPVILTASGAGQIFRLSQYDSFDPKLTVAVSGTNVVLSWAPPWPDYTLQSTTTLPPASWSAVPGGTNSPVTLPASGPARFFRLRK